MNTNDGGPAFPGDVHVLREYPAGGGPLMLDRAERFAGMSLRDYFAGQALIAYCSKEWADNAAVAFQERGEPPHDFVARRSYAAADAMLRARSASGEGEKG